MNDHATLIACPECGVLGLPRIEMVRHVERCVTGIRLGSTGTLRAAWERARERQRPGEKEIPI